MTASGAFYAYHQSNVAVKMTGLGCAFRDNFQPQTSFYECYASMSGDSFFTLNQNVTFGSNNGIRSQSFVNVLFVFQLSLVETSI